MPIELLRKSDKEYGTRCAEKSGLKSSTSVSTGLQ
jgi:hypothetical protein